MKKELNEKTLQKTQTSQTEKVETEEIVQTETFAIESVENEIVDAKRQITDRTAEWSVTMIFIALGIFFYLINMSSLAAISVLAFGACWNFFTDSNKMFACIFAFATCSIYAYLCVQIGMYAHAFLHIAFYLPTQLIYFFENQNHNDVSILKNKKLEPSGVVVTTIAGALLTLGLGAVVYSMGEEMALIDSISAVLLMVSVFLVNGRYCEYYAVRIFAVGFAMAMWALLAVIYNFADGTIAFALLFAMYLVMDVIKCIRFNKATKTQN